MNKPLRLMSVMISMFTWVGGLSGAEKSSSLLSSFASLSTAATSSRLAAESARSASSAPLSSPPSSFTSPSNTLLIDTDLDLLGEDEPAPSSVPSSASAGTERLAPIVLSARELTGRISTPGTARALAVATAAQHTGPSGSFLSDAQRAHAHEIIRAYSESVSQPVRHEDVPDSVRALSVTTPEGRKTPISDILANSRVKVVPSSGETALDPDLIIITPTHTGSRSFIAVPSPKSFAPFSWRASASRSPSPSLTSSFSPTPTAPTGTMSSSSSSSSSSMSSPATAASPAPSAFSPISFSLASRSSSPATGVMSPGQSSSSPVPWNSRTSSPAGSPSPSPVPFSTHRPAPLSRVKSGIGLDVIKEGWNEIQSPLPPLPPRK